MGKKYVEKPIEGAQVPWDSEWRQIYIYAPYYISQYGHVFNMRTKRLQARFWNSHERPIVCVRLYINGVRRTLSIAKLVRESFGEHKGEYNMSSMQEQVPAERPDSVGNGRKVRKSSADAGNRQSAFGLPNGRGKDDGSENDSGSSSGDSKEVVFLLIPPTDDSTVWNTQFYMCGACMHAFKLRDVEEHARDLHGATGAKLYSTATDWVEDNGVS